MHPIAKTVILIGVLLIAAGVLSNWIPFGRLPGDFSFTLGSVRVYIPLGTSLLISVLLTLIFYLFRR